MRNRFVRLFGNEGVKNRIGQAIQDGRVPHAFLIDGDSGSGKMTLALEIAAALNCEHKADEAFPLPCGRCNNCTRIYDKSFVDVQFLERRSGKATIGVDDFKLLRKDMFLSSTESDYKVYIITEAEKLTPEAQNAMLIVLEEPPKNVVIILLASGTDRILTTIKSRTQYIAMSRFTPEQIAEYLKGNNEYAARIARLEPETFSTATLGADGKIGEALKLMNPSDSKEYIEWREDIQTFISSLGSRAHYSNLYNAVGSMPSKRPELLTFLEGIILALRDIITVKKSDECSTLFYKSRDEAMAIAKDINIARLLRIYDLINKAHSDCTKNANMTALLTNLAASIKLA